MSRLNLFVTQFKGIGYTQVAFFATCKVDCKLLIDEPIFAFIDFVDSQVSGIGELVGVLAATADRFALLVGGLDGDLFVRHNRPNLDVFPGEVPFLRV